MPVFRQDDTAAEAGDQQGGDKQSQATRHGYFLMVCIALHLERRHLRKSVATLSNISSSAAIP
jgi:hypothetical protein